MFSKPNAGAGGLSTDSKRPPDAGHSQNGGIRHGPQALHRTGGAGRPVGLRQLLRARSRRRLLLRRRCVLRRRRLKLVLRRAELLRRQATSARARLRRLVRRPGLWLPLPLRLWRQRVPVLAPWRAPLAVLLRAVSARAAPPRPPRPPRPTRAPGTALGGSRHRRQSAAAPPGRAPGRACPRDSGAGAARSPPAAGDAPCRAGPSGAARPGRPVARSDPARAAAPRALQAARRPRAGAADPAWRGPQGAGRGPPAGHARAPQYSPEHPPQHPAAPAPADFGRAAPEGRLATVALAQRRGDVQASCAD